MKQRLANFALLGVGLTSGLAAPLAAAESPQVPPPSTARLADESLAHALADFARRTGLQLVYVSSDVNGVACKAVPDGLAARETLQRLLECTGLSFEFINERTVRIFRQGTAAPANAATSSSAQTQADSPADVSSTTTATDKAARGDAVANRRERVTIKKQGFLSWMAGMFTVCGPLISAGSAFCQTAEGTSASTASASLEEVIVTAERRVSDIQNTATSVSVRTGVELATQGRYSTRQILDDVPGVTALDNDSLNVGSADVQGNNITIRGITPGDSAGGGPSQISATPPTAVYVDGIYEGIGSNYDIERVEVLRGPQGTLYGRSATAGVVGFHTRNPSLDGFEGTAAAEAGNYDLQHYTGAVNIPIADVLAVRLSGDYRNQDEGYFGDATRGMRERTGGRAKVLWQPTDTLSLLMGFAYDKDDAFSGLNSRTANLARDVTTLTAGLYPGHKQSRQYWADFNWDLGPVTLTYLPAFRTWEQDDLLLQSANFIQSGVPLLQIIKTPLDEFHTQELRFASDDDAAIKWQAGAFYYRNKLRSTNHNFLAGAGDVELSVQSDTKDQKDTKNVGFFAETTLPLNDAMRMTLGARYDDTEVIVSESYFDNPYAFCGTSLEYSMDLPSGVTCVGPGQASEAPPPGDSVDDVGVKFHNFNYKARFEYDLTPKNMMYAMISTGFRPGDAGISNHELNIVDAEKLTSIEIGSKNRFLDDSLQLNVGLYQYRYRGFQTTYTPETAADVDPASGTLVRVTVPAENLGGELELLYQVTPNDLLGLNYNYVQSRWQDKPAEFALAQPEKERALTPSTLTANYQHIFNLPGGSTWSARIEGKYESSHLTSDLHVDYLRMGLRQYMQVGARTVGNLNSTWSSADGRYSVSGYVRNFTDKKYTTYSLVGDPTNLDVDWNDPRTYGVVLSVTF